MPAEKVSKALLSGLIAVMTLLAGHDVMATTYLSNATTGDPTSLTAWTNSAGANPADFLEGDTFTIQNGHKYTIAAGATWFVNASNAGTAATVQINSGGTLAFNNSTADVLALGGNLVRNGVITNLSGSQSATITFTANGSWTGSGDVSLGGSTAKISITVNSGVTLDATGLTGGFKLGSANTKGITVNGTLNLGTNTVNGNSGGTSFFTLGGSGTLITANTNASGLPGIFTGFSGSKITLPNTANYTYNGTGPQFTGISANNATNPVSCNNLTISNAAGVTLSQAMTVTNLTLAAGKVTGNITNASGGTIAGGSSTAYINGQLTVPFTTPTSASFLFPIGTASAYSPIGLTNFTDTGTGTLTASATASTPPNLGSSGIDNSLYIARYWTLTNSSGSFSSPTYNFTGTYVAGDIQNGADPANLIVRKWNGTSWDAPASSSSVAYTVTGTSFTNFPGQFAAGQAQTTIPILDSTTKAAITNTAATLGATLENNFSLSITDYGIVWGTSLNPTTSGNKVQVGTTTPTLGSPFTASVTGLPAATTIYYRGYAINSSLQAGYSTNGSFLTLANEPTTQATYGSGYSFQNGNVNVSWIRGNGAKCIVLVNAAGSVNANPVDGTTYTASAASPFGTQIGSGNYVAYLGTGTNVTLTGLATSTTYSVAVYELNGSAGSENYLAPPATGSQTAVASPISSLTWTGGGADSDWNNTNNWDLQQVPDVGTPAIIPSGPANQPVYSNQMVAASIGSVTSAGTLTINTNGFKSGTIFMSRTDGSAQMYVNTGGVVSVTGNLGICSNGIASMSVGSSVTISGGLNIGSDTVGGAGGTGTLNGYGKMTNSGGVLIATSTALNPKNQAFGSAGNSCLLVINGGTNNLGAVDIHRSGGTSQASLGSEGLMIYGGLVNMTSLQLGDNNFGSMLITAGTVVTNTGAGTIRNSTAGRPSRLLQTGGLFVTLGTNTMTVPTAAGSGVTFSVTGGTNYTTAFQFGDPAVPANIGTINFTNSGNIFVGSGGMAYNGGAGVVISLDAGGRFGASADWTNAMAITLNGGVMDCEDATGTPHNILSYGSLNSGTLTKAGSGTLTLAGANSCSAMNINSGTVALSTNASGTPASFSSSVTINVGSNTVFDVSPLASVGGFMLGSSKTIAGVGTVAGTFAAGSGANISPAGIGAQGTLTFANGLAATNAIFRLDLTSDPTGTTLTNDFVKITGDLNLSGTSTIAVTPVGSLGLGTYKLIGFTGNLNGGLANLTCAAGTLITNTGEIDLVVTSVRPVAGLVWRGDGSANLWNTAGASNWLNGLVYDRFYTGDTNTFDDSATNFVVNLAGIVSPASASVVTVNATNNYTFADGGSGDLSGNTGLTKTNSGNLTILTANDYQGVTTLAGGTVIVASLADGSTATPIGAAPSASGNLVFNGGALEYIGGNKTINRGATFQSGGGSLNISNAATTLTISGSLTGPGALTKTGNGQLTLTGGNDFSGGATINAGIIRANPSGTLGTNALTLNGGAASSATFQFAGDGQTMPNVVNVVGTNNFITTGGNDTLNKLTGTGMVHLEQSGNKQTLTLQAIDSTAFNGTFSADTLAFLRFAPSSGTTLTASNALFDLGAGTNTLINRDGGSYYIGALAGGPNTQVQGSANSGSASTTYTIGGRNTDSTFAGVIKTGTGGTGASVNIVKVGTGTLTLSGVNTYTGTTTVNSGTLAVNGSLGSSSAVTVNGGTLAGSGTIGGATTLNAGTILSAGNNSAGTLTFSGNLTLDPASTNSFAVTTAGGASNSVSVAGTLSPNSSVIQITSGASLAVGTYTLFTYGGISGSFNPTPVFDVAPAANAAIVDTGSQIQLVIATGPSGPEPITSSFNGSTLTLTWPSGHSWRLVSQTNTLSSGLNPDGAAWGTVPGVSDGSAAITVDPNQPTVFYRLVYP